MRDKEMIEEMVEFIKAQSVEYNANCDKDCDDCPYGDCVGKLAEELLRHYQPKIPEGSVVMSEEEWRQIKNSLYYSKEELENKLERVRKETARKILNAMLDIKPDFRLLDGCTPSEFMRSVDLATNIIFQAVKEQAKRYGVEVEK